MIQITKLDSLLAEVLREVPGITEHHLCVHEGHASMILSDKQGMQLLCIYPSANRVGSINEAVDQNVTWLFLLEKAVEANSRADEVGQFSKLQVLIEQVRDYIEEVSSTTHCYLQRIDTSKSQIVPEYREFGGWNGWSLSLVF